MSVHIRKIKNNNGTTFVQIEQRSGNKRLGLKHIGTAHNENELDLLCVLAYEKMHERQMSFDFIAKSDWPRSESEATLEKAYSELLWDTLKGVYASLGFDCLDDDTFCQLVLARIIEPSSKLDTIRILENLGLDAPSYSTIKRGLKCIVDDNYRDKVSNICFGHCHPSSLTLVLYDVTTLYFETDEEDEYRIPGYSKERRLEPQITVGLLVNAEGYPLEVQSFEGNKGEVKTIIPVLESFRQKHGLADITVTADAAMLSEKNIELLEELGYKYIIGSKLTKTPYGVKLSLEKGITPTDEQIFESPKMIIIKGKKVTRREIFQYKHKRAYRDLLNVDKALVKAQKYVSGKVSTKKNRYLKVGADKPEIDWALVEEVRERAGIKGYLTNLDIPPQQVIDYYHQLHQVEKSFRMSKSDLKARPIFHRKKDSIEAHLTIVFTALALSRYIEFKSKMSIRRFVRTLEPIKTGIASTNGKMIKLKPKVTETISELLRKIRS